MAVIARSKHLPRKLYSKTSLIVAHCPILDILFTIGVEISIIPFGPAGRVVQKYGKVLSMMKEDVVLRDLALNWLEQVDAPLFLLTTDLRVHWTNASAQALMRRLNMRVDAFGMCKSDSKEREQKAQAVRRQLLEAIKACRSWQQGTQVVTLAEFPEAAIQLYELTMDGTSLIGCVVTDAKHGAKDMTTLLSQYGLTVTERKVVGMMASGSTPTEIARTNGSSLLTVRTHIKRIYAKMEVNSREKMFARLTNGDYGSPDAGRRAGA